MSDAQWEIVHKNLFPFQGIVLPVLGTKRQNGSSTPLPTSKRQLPTSAPLQKRLRGDFPLISKDGLGGVHLKRSLKKRQRYCHIYATSSRPFPLAFQTVLQSPR